jgi:ArsR family transcriptional regulator, arsenate/arsenite/antimonite-responsive transcriptional repressor
MPLDIIQLMLKYHFMESKNASNLFEALSSEARLDIFRLLVKNAPEGLVAGDISRQLSIPSTNLSFHFKALTHRGLVDAEREGRFMRYKANIPLMLDVIAYLTNECCSANPSECCKFRAASGILPGILPNR